MPLTINTDIATVATGSTAPGSATLIGGFNGVLLQPVSVKAASTAAVATDPALVVAVSPNNSLIISGTVQQLGGDLFTAGALGALSASVTVPAAGFQSVGFHMGNGTFRGTIAPEISIDNGTNWVSTFWETPNTGAKTSTLAIAANYAPVVRTILVPGGVSHARVRVTAYTSGTANALIRATQLGRNVISSESATGSAIPTTALMVGGTDATNLRALLVDTSGRLAIVGAGASTGALTGNPVAVAGSIVDGASYSTHRGTMIGTKGSDGLYHHVVSDALGNVKMIMSPTASSIHSSSVVTSSSNSGAISAFGARCISLYYTVSSATPSGGTMTYTVEELSADVTTVIRSSSKTFSTTGSGVVHLGSVNSYYIRVSWTLTGGAPSYTVTSSIYASSNVGSMNEGAPGDAIPLQTALVGGTDGGTLRSIAVSTAGQLRTTDGGIPTYAASSYFDLTAVTSGGASAFTVWHASANATPIFIRRIKLTIAGANIAAGKALLWTLGFISAENGTPGGTLLVGQPYDRADSASTLTGANGAIRLQPANPTTVGDLFWQAMSGGSDTTLIFDCQAYGKPIELRASTAEGIECRYGFTGTVTAGPFVGVTIEYTEGTAITLGYI
jgi:hypothetical protein